MQSSNQPGQISVAFATSGQKQPIPVASQIGIEDGRASYQDGFPPLTRTPLAAGGVPPFGTDMNGILNAITAIQQWQSAGGLFKFDATFAASVGGYPKGAMLVRADGDGIWQSSIENNTNNPDTGGAGWVPVVTGLIPQGQCRLNARSATLIALDPYQGNRITISGLQRQIPPAGVTLTNAGMNINTLYYIYAFWNGTAISLEFSATGHSTDTATGVEIKTGDSSRTLVGMIRTDASAQFADGPAARLVASWFNRKSVAASITTTGAINFTSTSNAEISTSVRLLFLTWASEAVDIKAAGQYTNSTATQSVAVQSYVDASAYGNTSASYIPANGVGMSFASMNSMTPSGAYLSEGFHTASIYGAVTGNTGTVNYLAHSLISRI